MKPKRIGWNEGVMSEDLVGFGFTHKKGSTVRFKRYKTMEDKYGKVSTKYEWHYMDQNNYNLIRSTRRMIEGLPFLQEEYL